MSLSLSGTSSLEQLKDNLRIFDHAKPGMSEEDQNLIVKIRKACESKRSSYRIDEEMAKTNSNDVNGRTGLIHL